MAWLNVAKIIDVTQAEGPGLRTAIWVQGCLKRCIGCCNGQFLKIQPADVCDSLMIIEQIVQNQQQYGIEGVTLLGGEPFLQAEGLADIAQACRKMGLSVMVFSGYELEELDDLHFKGASKLLEFTDVLVDGEYQQALTENVRNWVGSTNQRFHYFTNFYDPSIETRMLTVTNEWRIDAQGIISGNGLPFILHV
ncbi:4Fe-4S single cluster domain-containing protein [Acinetobacter sp. CAAS 2-6]|uniref:4Fe-4S single cluster domain-containing protein n=1 Tax=Acinetobacter sp. CAAS 2-6 TaxID=3016358 RepID=UPI002DD660D1|nr:4Fe-4S single cluster domain-containing protein [Acinetobacter sp. CAAS 2-6]